MLKAARVRHIRFHDAHHTCGTLMHLQDVPMALIFGMARARIEGLHDGHLRASQPEALSTAAQSFTRVVTNRDNSG
jgi:hypothetical protein